MPSKTDSRRRVRRRLGSSTWSGWRSCLLRTLQSETLFAVNLPIAPNDDRLRHQTQGWDSIIQTKEGTSTGDFSCSVSPGEFCQCRIYQARLDCPVDSRYSNDILSLRFQNPTALLSEGELSQEEGAQVRSGSTDSSDWRMFQWSCYCLPVCRYEAEVRGEAFLSQDADAVQGLLGGSKLSGHQCEDGLLPPTSQDSGPEALWIASLTEDR